MSSNIPGGAAGQPVRGLARLFIRKSVEQMHAEHNASELKRSLNSLNLISLGIGCIIVLASLPVAYLLVRRVFLPIRQLVTATQRIAAGAMTVGGAPKRYFLAMSGAGLDASIGQQPPIFQDHAL